MTISYTATITFNYNQTALSKYQATIKISIFTDQNGDIPPDARSSDTLLGETLAKNWGCEGNGYRSKTATVSTNTDWQVLDKMATDRAITVIEQLRKTVTNNREAASLTPATQTIANYI
jgi:hypothetical protein